MKRFKIGVILSTVNPRVLIMPRYPKQRRRSPQNAGHGDCTDRADRVLFFLILVFALLLTRMVWFWSQISVQLYIGMFAMLLLLRV